MSSASKSARQPSTRLGPECVGVLLGSRGRVGERARAVTRCRLIDKTPGLRFCSCFRKKRRDHSFPRRPLIGTRSRMLRKNERASHFLGNQGEEPREHERRNTLAHASDKGSCATSDKARVGHFPPPPPAWPPPSRRTGHGAEVLGSRRRRDRPWPAARAGGGFGDRASGRRSSGLNTGDGVWALRCLGGHTCRRCCAR